MLSFRTICILFGALCFSAACPAAAHSGKPAFRAPGKPAAARRPAHQAAPAALARIAAPAAVVLPAVRPTVNVQGTVYGPNGRVLPGACVHLFGSPAPLAVANADGEFLLASVPATAVLHLQAEYQGLKPVQLDMDVPHARAVRVVLDQR